MNHRIKITTKDIMTDVFKSDNLVLYQYVKQYKYFNLLIVLEGPLCTYAASHGALNISKYAREHGGHWDIQTCTGAAIG